jgi:hypothetical protein
MLKFNFRARLLLYAATNHNNRTSMTPEGIYVEIAIAAPMDEVWEHTQNPALHQQWDLRFSTIEYLPKQTAAAPQRFRYTTRLGFGIQVAGEGESTGTRTSDARSSDMQPPAPAHSALSPVAQEALASQETSAAQQRTSALKFWSAQPISLIESGSGYWQYVPTSRAIRFLTWYDYRVRWGRPGALIDRWLFRPLMGWATAWSFDALRLWLEQGIHPAQSMRRLAIHATVHLALALIWIYQGLVPKLLFPESGEVEILRAAVPVHALADPALHFIVLLIGVGQIAFGLLFLTLRFAKPLHYLNILALLGLGLGALWSQAALFVAPFSPAPLTLAMIALSVIGLANAKDLPRAANCLRKPAP